MKSKLIIILLALFAVKANAISVTISADDFAVGTVLSDIEGITLTAETSSNGQISSSDVAIRRTQSSFFGTEYYRHNHFSASGEIHSLYIRELFAPNASANYTNLFSINFSSASSFTSLKMKAEATSGSPIGLLAYDKNGNFRAAGHIGATGPRNEDGSLDYFFNRDFGFELGSIKVGSLSDAAYFYEITAYVPEPSLLNLFFLGLLLIAFRLKLTSAK